MLRLQSPPDCFGGGCVEPTRDAPRSVDPTACTVDLPDVPEGPWSGTSLGRITAMSRARLRIAVLLVAGSLVVSIAGSGRSLANRTGGDADADRGDIVACGANRRHRGRAARHPVLRLKLSPSSSLLRLAGSPSNILNETSPWRFTLATSSTASNDRGAVDCRQLLHASPGRACAVRAGPRNHGTDANRVGPIDDYFAPATMPWITETMTTGRIENNYTLVNIGPRQWLSWVLNSVRATPSWPGPIAC